MLWPFFSYINDREKKYREWEAPWPFFVLARGEGKTTTRFWPLFSHAHSPTLESDFYLWPIYKYNRVHSDPLDRHRTRILFFLYSDVTQKNTETGATQRRVDFWPLFTYHREFGGASRLQIAAVLEPFLPNNKSIERDYSPLWSFWRSEKNPTTGGRRQPIAVVEPVSARDAARLQKMLAPLRPLPVSIRCRRQTFAFISFPGRQGQGNSPNRGATQETDRTEGLSGGPESWQQR